MLAISELEFSGRAPEADNSGDTGGELEKLPGIPEAPTIASFSKSIDSDRVIGPWPPLSNSSKVVSTSVKSKATSTSERTLPNPRIDERICSMRR